MKAAASLLCVGLTVCLAFPAPVDAQNFSHQEIFLISRALPDAGGAVEGVLRIDRDTFAGTFIPGPAGVPMTTRPAYDSFRDLILLPVPGFGLYTLDGAGAFSTIAYSGDQSALIAAPARDGRVYFFREGSETFFFLDSANSTHELMDPFSGLGYVNAATTAMRYHRQSDSLVTADQSDPGVVTFRRHALTFAGDAVTGSISATVDVSTSDEVAVAMSPGPNGMFFVKIDDQTDDAVARMMLLDPMTLNTTVFAASEYAGVGVATAGVFRSRTQVSLNLDTANDVLRTYASGGSGLGTVVAENVSDPATDGEMATLIEIRRCAGDIDLDGLVDGADLAFMLSAWGEPDSDANIDFNGSVDGADLALLLALWGTCD